MHVVGARFDRVSAARAALAELRDQFDLAPGDIAVRPLGSTDYETRHEHQLLAGRIEDHHVAAVIAALRRAGGVIVELRGDAPGAAPIVLPAPEVPPWGSPSSEPRPGSGRPTARPRRPADPWSPPLRRSPRAVRARGPRPRRVRR